MYFSERGIRTMIRSFECVFGVSRPIYTYHKFKSILNMIYMSVELLIDLKILLSRGQKSKITRFRRNKSKLPIIKEFPLDLRMKLIRSRKLIAPGYFLCPSHFSLSISWLLLMVPTD